MEYPWVPGACTILTILETALLVSRMGNSHRATLLACKERKHIAELLRARWRKLTCVHYPSSQPIISYWESNSCIVQFLYPTRSQLFISTCNTHRLTLAGRKTIVIAFPIAHLSAASQRTGMTFGETFDTDGLIKPTRSGYSPVKLIIICYSCSPHWLERMFAAGFRTDWWGVLSSVLHTSY
jgi:hypothetical protein